MDYGLHPYLLINNMDLKSKADESSFIWNPIKEKADADLLSQPLKPADPDGWLWEILDRTKERILRGCIVYKVTGDDRYLEAMKKQLWCLIDEWPWIEKYHHEEVKLEADLRTGIIMYTLGLVYDWMYVDFSMEDRKRVLSAIIDKGYPMLKKDIEADAFYLTSYGNNWLAVMLGGFAAAALATIDENRYSSEILDLALERTKIMSTFVGADGAWEEGPFYWGGIAFLIMFFDIIDSLPGSKTNLLKTESLLKTSEFPIYMNMPSGGRANFSDAHYFQDHNASYLFSVMAKIAQNPNYQWAFKEFRNVSEFSKPELEKIEIRDFRPPEETYQFLAYDENLKAEYPDKWPLFKLFQGDTYGFIASRNGFGRNDKGLTLCANGGTNGTNHHQLDIGQIIMTYNKFNFIYDPGYGRAFFLDDGQKVSRQNYFAKSSMGHNIVTINGENQIDSPKARGAIRNCVSNEYMDLFEIELTTAYENCDCAVRMVKRRRDLDIIEVEDFFNLAAYLPLRLAWFYRGEARIEDENTVMVQSPAGMCRIIIESVEQLTIALESYSEKGYMDRNNKPIYPEVYNYIYINVEPGLKHHLKTTFYFT